MATKKNDKQYITLAEYEQFKKKIWGKDAIWTTLKERDELEAEQAELYKRLMPEVGMGATEMLYSDRRAQTITAVISPDMVYVRECDTKCLNYYAGDYEIYPDKLVGGEMCYTRHKSGRWVALGQPDKNGSVWMILGTRHHYIDPSF